ncbi:hypothetical protein E8E13_006162 [Curvularia kusanoi]|uniref:Uncharacterized protein n=1 Tax=Curvularia kusanoi TaxID=90978 RepID=A0A9P4W838_CURKU|nr:hypothetical protein E8E13_006162 [Curvularia kusanoi]
MAAANAAAGYPPQGGAPPSGAPQGGQGGYPGQQQYQAYPGQQGAAPPGQVSYSFYSLLAGSASSSFFITRHVARGLRNLLNILNLLLDFLDRSYCLKSNCLSSVPI